ncbi:CHAP domain-containing protein [Streptomyces sp. NPDC089919]|uniref:RCC1 domain-containing protein n=1 Tax=Streptomyces sp. NPDC089919 TaxID=3155188 RepID=UPI003425D14D
MAVRGLLTSVLVLAGGSGVHAGAGVPLRASAAAGAGHQTAYDSYGSYPHHDALPKGDPARGDFEKNGSVNSPAGYGYRNCTDYAWWRALEEFGTDIRGWGDAGQWDTGALAAGYRVDRTPEVGDLAQWEPTSPTGPGRFGHVAFVEEVRPDGGVEVAEYNKESDGEFQRRTVLPTGSGRFRMPEHFIDLNGPNTSAFRLRLFADGTPAPRSADEQAAFDRHNAAVATARANQKLFEEIPDGRSVRGDNGAWYLRRGGTLQWVVTGDPAARAIGLDARRFGAGRHYTEAMIHTKEEGYTYPYTQRDKDHDAGLLGSRVGTPVGAAEMDRAARSLGFDRAVLLLAQGAKGWRFVKRDKQYAVNMDLVAMAVARRTDVFAYPTDWRGPTSWRAYTFKARTQRSAYFSLPFGDVPLASHLRVADLPAYGKRLEYLYAAPAGAPCTVPGTLCSWGTNSPLRPVVGAPYRPGTVAGPDRVVAVSGSSLTNGYALTAQGTLWAWGHSFNGQLGNGTHASNTVVTVPVKVRIDRVTAVAAGQNATLALRTDGTVWSWGCNHNGELGLGQPPQDQVVDVPTRIPGLSSIVQVAVGGMNGYALDANGRVWAWGDALRGRLANGKDGTGRTDDAYAPVRVEALTGVRSIAASAMNGFALRTDGTVWAWGEGDKYGGALGSGTDREVALFPAKVKGLTGVKAIASSLGLAGYALREDGRVWAWGWNQDGELGRGTSGAVDGPEHGHSSTAAPVKNLTAVTSIGSGYGNGYAVRADGSVWAWGHNGGGELGQRWHDWWNPAPQPGALDLSAVPLRVPGVTSTRPVLGGGGAGYAVTG